MPASAFEEVAHGKPGDNGEDYRQDTISGAVSISQRGQHGRKPHHDHLQIAALLADYLIPLDHHEANPVGAGFNLGGKRYSSGQGLKILRSFLYLEASGEGAINLFAFLELKKLVQKPVA